MRLSIKSVLVCGLSLLIVATDSGFAQRHKGNKYNKRNKNSFESRMNRKKTGMLNSKHKSKRSGNRYLGSNRVKKKNNQYARSNYYTSRARGKRGRAGSFNYRANGTRHNSTRPYKSGRKKFSHTKKSPFKARQRRNYKSSGNKGTLSRQKKKTSRGLGRSHRYRGRQPGARSSSNFTSRKNKRTARKKKDNNKADKKFRYNKRGSKGGKRKTGRTKRRGRGDKPDFRYNKRKYEKNKRKNMRKSTRKRLNPRD